MQLQILQMNYSLDDKSLYSNISCFPICFYLNSHSKRTHQFNKIFQIKQEYPTWTSQIAWNGCWLPSGCSPIAHDPSSIPAGVPIVPGRIVPNLRRDSILQIKLNAALLLTSSTFMEAELSLSSSAIVDIKL